jgi:hypothetical protein
MSKPKTYRDYDPRRIELAESALLTIWGCLAELHQNLVLVGGLVPKYLCGEVRGPTERPRPATMDVDIGIAVSADEGHGGSLFRKLTEQGFKWSNDSDSSRFMKTINGIEVFIDFITEDPSRAQFGAIPFDLIHVSQLPGINRALTNPRLVTVEGVDLDGNPRSHQIRVCNVGPFLVLKLRAFLNRRENKDAFDIYFMLRHFVDGTGNAIKAFAAEMDAENSAFPDAMTCLRAHYTTEDSLGPVATANFVEGQSVAGESEETALRRLLVRQEVVDGATLLLRALENTEG